MVTTRPRAGLDRRADGFDIHPVDERVVDDGGLDAFLGEFLAGLDGLVDQHAAATSTTSAAGLEHLRLAPRIRGVLDPVKRIVLAADEEDVALAILARRAVGRLAFDGLIHQRLGLVRAGRRDHHRVRDGAGGGEVGRGLVGSAVGGILEADVREHRDDRRLRERGHGQRQVALGHAELAEGVHDGNEAGLGKARRPR